jgi:hypothetical protein
VRNGKILFFSIAILLGGFSAKVGAAPAINEFAVDFPFDGGGFVSYTRSWVLSPYMDVGVSAGGGVINREFDVTYPSVGDVSYETKALVLPFIGPRLGLHYEFIGLSVGYGAFYADTDIEARDKAGNTYAGSEKGWGTGFYAPLLVLDFYNNRRDMYFGVGLGGFLGANYPNLEAARGSTTLVTNESPVDSLTLTFRMRFFDGHGPSPVQENRDDF